MDDDYDEMVQHVSNLPEELSSYIDTSYLNAMVHRLYYRFISKFVAQGKLANITSFSQEIVQAIDHIKHQDDSKTG